MNARDILTKDEVRALSQASDWRGAASVIETLVWIAGAFALVAWQPNALTVAVALLILGGRQLGLAILMHECSHRSLFASRALNLGVGRWICAALIWNHLDAYREHHLRHHTRTGTEGDPDRGLVEPFPTTRGALARKIARDLTGISGLKRIFGLLAMDLGFVAYTASTEVRRLDQHGRSALDVVQTGVRNLGPTVLANAALFGVLALTGHPALYLLWIAAWMTTFGLFLRIRSIAEHACTAWTDDPLHNTRTTYANLLARLTVAPHHVNYHLEHHLLMTVPHYNLPRLHALLEARGVFDDDNSAPGYLDVLRRATTPAAI